MILRWLAWRNASELALLIARSMASEPGEWEWVPHGGRIRNAALNLEVTDVGRVYENRDPRSFKYAREIELSLADSWVVADAYDAVEAERRRVAREEALHQMEQRRANLTESIKRLRRNRLEAA